MAQTKEMTPAMRRFVQKVRWEGGVLNAIDYGIKSTDVPDRELAQQWAEIERLYGEVRPLISSVERAVEAA